MGKKMINKLITIGLLFCFSVSCGLEDEKDIADVRTRCCEILDPARCEDFEFTRGEESALRKYQVTANDSQNCPIKSESEPLFEKGSSFCYLEQCTQFVCTVI
jgi:hypothetical protein